MKLSGARIPCSVVALQFIATSCLLPVLTTLSHGDGPAIPEELGRVLTDYEAAWEKKDAVALSMLFTEDGYVLASDHAPVRGRAAIAKHYEGSGGPLALHAFSWRYQGQIAYIVGGYAREVGEPDVGKFTLTLQWTGEGKWLIFSDMDNSNRAR